MERKGNFDAQDNSDKITLWFRFHITAKLSEAAMNLNLKNAGV